MPDSATSRFPSAYIIQTEPNPDHPDYLIVQIDCPYCGGIHTHGASPDCTIDPGHRASHCGQGNGYVVRWARRPA